MMIPSAPPRSTLARSVGFKALGDVAQGNLLEVYPSIFSFANSSSIFRANFTFGVTAKSSASRMARPNHFSSSARILEE